MNSSATAFLTRDSSVGGKVEQQAAKCEARLFRAACSESGGGAPGACTEEGGVVGWGVVRPKACHISLLDGAAVTLVMRSFHILDFAALQTAARWRRASRRPARVASERARAGRRVARCRAMLASCTPGTARLQCFRGG